MAAFINNDITEAGLLVLAKGVSGQQITYTRIVLGDGFLEDGQTPRSLTSVVSPKADVAISKIKLNGDGTVIVGGIFTNGDTNEGFFYRELGLYAQDPDNGEVLYCYGNCGNLAEWIPPAGGATIVEKTIDIVTAIGSATHVTASINPDAYATKQELQENHSFAQSIKETADTAVQEIQIAGKNQTKTGTTINITELATTTTPGLMSTTDKSKLDSLGKNLTLTGAVTGTYNGQSPASFLIPDRKGCRFIIGTSTNGWTEKDCDYLCDGTADQVEINNALSALPSTGGEIVILDGIYNIAATINVNKENVTLQGNGCGTVLHITAPTDLKMLSVLSDGCNIANFAVESTSISSRDSAIFIDSSFNIIENLYFHNIMDSQKGVIRINSGDYNIVQNNLFTAAHGYFIWLAKDSNNTIVNSNVYYHSGDASGFNGFLMVNFEKDDPKKFTCVNNRAYFYTTTIISYYHSVFIRVYNAIDSIISNNYGEEFYRGLEFYHIFNSTIEGNVIKRVLDIAALVYLHNSIFSGNALLEPRSRGFSMSEGEKSIISDNLIHFDTYGSNQYSIFLGSETENNLISDNLIFGKNYYNGGTGNTFVNNKYN